MKEQLFKIWNNPKRTSVVIGVLAFNAGVGLGYILGRRKVVEIHEVDDQLAFNFTIDELREIREASRQQRIISTKPNTIKAEKFVRKQIEESLIVPEQVVEDEEELVTKSIFADDDWDYALEVSKRTEDAPYVIHKDEFYADEKDYTQMTLTYYSGDNIMVDEDDSPVYNHELITGPLLFGHGSGDSNVVHIRNDKRRAEYEVLFDSGLYSVEVLGLEIEDNQRVKDLKHSRHKKFRLE